MTRCGNCFPYSRREGKGRRMVSPTCRRPPKSVPSAAVKERRCSQVVRSNARRACFTLSSTEPCPLNAMNDFERNPRSGSSSCELGTEAAVPRSTDISRSKDMSITRLHILGLKRYGTYRRGPSGPWSHAISSNGCAELKGVALGRSISGWEAICWKRGSQIRGEKGL